MGQDAKHRLSSSSSRGFRQAPRKNRGCFLVHERAAGPARRCPPPSEKGPDLTYVRKIRVARYRPAQVSVRNHIRHSRCLWKYILNVVMFRFVDPTLAHMLSATAVLACIIGPFHSKTLTPASSKDW